MTVLAVALALLAAVGNAGGDLLQRSAARDESSDPRRSFSLLGHLLRQRRWLAGVLVSVLGLAVHVAALSVGELATVQPIVVCELLLAVLGSALFFGRRLARRDWAAVVALTAGLALFIVFLSPQAGDRLGVPGEVWAIGTAAVVAAMATLVVAALRAEHDLRGALLGAAAGLGHGLTGVFFSFAGRTLSDEGAAAALTTWQTYAALVTAVAAFVLLQNALAAGKLVAVEPGLALANPVLAVVWGLLVFGETAQTGAPLVGSALGAVLVVIGVVVLARSPVLENHGHTTR